MLWGIMPRQADPSERRATIVKAAYRILASEGLSVLSMRSVAKAAGVTTGMVTHWFASRDALLEAAMEIAAQREEQRARDTARSGADLIATMAAFLPLDPERADEVRVWIGFWAASIGNEMLLKTHRRRYRAWTRHLTDTGAVSDALSAQRIIAVVDGISIDAVLDPQHWPAEEQLAALNAAVGNASKTIMSTGSRRSQPRP